MVSRGAPSAEIRRLAPIVGYGHPDHAEPIAKAKLPLWVFAGGRDPVVPLRYFYPVLNKLEALGHPEVRFTVEEDLGHLTWVRVYEGQDLYSWMLGKSPLGIENQKKGGNFRCLPRSFAGERFLSGQNEPLNPSRI